MPNKPHRTFLWIGTLLSLPLCLGCQNVCEFNGLDCLPKSLLGAMPQVALDSTSPVTISFSRYLISPSAEFVISQPSSALPQPATAPSEVRWTHAIPSHSSECEPASDRTDARYSCKITISPKDMRDSGFKVGSAPVQFIEALDGTPTITSAAQPISFVYSQFVFHLDNADGSGGLPALTVPGTDAGLQEVEVVGPKVIKAARSYNAKGDGQDYRVIYAPTYTLASTAKPSGQTAWGMAEKEWVAATTFITASALWSTQYLPAPPTDRAALYKGSASQGYGELTSGLKAQLLLISPVNDFAFLALTDGSVQYFPFMMTGQPLQPALPAGTQQIQTLRLSIGSSGTTLLAATKDFQVRRYDLKALQPLLPNIALPLPDKAAGTLDALGVGDLNKDGSDDLVVASGGTLYIWEAKDPSHPQLVNTGTKIPGGALARSIAIGDVDGNGENDIVVATKDNLYVYLHDSLPN